jgi:hypothetical protein
VRLAWPSLVRNGEVPRPLSLEMGGVRLPVERTTDVSWSLAADLRRDRGIMLTRLVIRTAARTAATEALRKKHGEWAGVLSSLAGSALERADTRSWGLLPGVVSVVRLTLPAGDCTPLLHAGDGTDTMTVRGPSLTLHAGEVRVASARVWPAARDLEAGLARETAGHNTRETIRDTLRGAATDTLPPAVRTAGH